MFFSPPFSCSASLCEQLLAGGSGETPAYTLLEYCRITTSVYLQLSRQTFYKIGRLPYYYFLLLKTYDISWSAGLEDCRIITSFY